MGSIINRGGRLYAKVKGVDGKWRRFATGQPDTPEGRRAVVGWIQKTERRIEAERAAQSPSSLATPMTLRRYADL